MESTGVYWIPIFEILDARGFAVLLVNARDAKHVPGARPTSATRSGCSGFIRYGLLRASFRPKGQIAAAAGLSASARAVCWNTPASTSSTCRRR